MIARYLLLPFLSILFCYLNAFISCILWLCSGTYFFLLNPFSCVYFFTLPWSSAAASFCDLDPILTSFTFPVESLRLCVYFFTLPRTSVVFGSCTSSLFLLSLFSCAFFFLLCCDDKLRSLPSPIVIRYLLLSILLLGSLQLCLDLYFALIISCIRVVLWLCFGTYFFLLKPFSCVYFFTLPWSSAAASFCDLDPILTSFTFPVESLSALCLLLYFAANISCICVVLWLCDRHLLLPVESFQLCVYFFTLQWSSVVFASFSDCDTILTSFTFTSWIPSVVFPSLLCCDHQLRLLPSPIVIGNLHPPLLLLGSLQLGLLLYFAVIISCIRVVLWLWSDTYFFPFYFLDPSSCA